MSLPALVLLAGSGVLLPLGTAAADAAPMHARGTLRVAITGSDSGNCQSSPCKTLGYALTQYYCSGLLHASNVESVLAS